MTTRVSKWTIVGTVARLLFSFLLVGFFSSMDGGIVPPGNVWSIGSTMALGMLVIGALWAGRRYYCSILFLMYGLFGGAIIGHILLPDSRDYIGISMGHSTLARYVISYCICVVVCGLLCMITGRIRTLQQLDLHGPPTCRTCGYSLTGNTSGICPECGTAVGSHHDPQAS